MLSACIHVKKESSADISRLPFPKMWSSVTWTVIWCGRPRPTPAQPVQGTTAWLATC